MPAQSSTTTPTNQDDAAGVVTIHLNISIIGGDSEDIEKFHTMLGWLDADWPYHHEVRSLQTCTKCGGVVYKNPLVAPQDIKLAGRLHNVTVKINRYCQDTVCGGDQIRWTQNDRFIAERRSYGYGHGVARA
jgi:hypothetical protein